MSRSNLRVAGREPLESDTPKACEGGDALAENGQAKYDGPDRRTGAVSAWQDPRFYLSAAALLLTIVLALFGYIATQISTISATLATLSRDSGKQDVRLDKLEEWKKERESKDDKVVERMDSIAHREDDYHYNLSQRLSVIEGQMKNVGK